MLGPSVSLPSPLSLLTSNSKSPPCSFLLKRHQQFFCVVNLIKKETRFLWVRVNHSVDRLAQHFRCPALAHCPASFLNPVKILAKCMKASLVRSKKPAVASTFTSFADASKLQSDAGSDLTCLDSLFRRVSCSLYVQTLLQREEGKLYTQSKCQRKSVLEEGKRKVRELRSLFDLSSLCDIVDRE